MEEDDLDSIIGMLNDNQGTNKFQAASKGGFVLERPG